MKNTIILLMITVATACLATTGCFKQPDEPNIVIDVTVPNEKVYTLKNLIDSIAVFSSLPYTFDTAWIFATVTMDENNGNLYKQLYVQDATHAIRLIFTESTGFVVGDSVRVYLKGKTLVDNHGSYEIQTLQPDSSVVVLATQRFITPQKVTLSELKGDSKLVEIIDVEFSEFDMGDTWADTTRTVSAVNHTLRDCDGNTVLVRTSSYANFAGRTLPGGKGSMMAIDGIYKSGNRSDIQLWNRTLSETKMDDYRCDGSSGKNLIALLKESFANGQGDFTTHDFLGDQTWTWSSQYSCMVMAGRNNNTNYGNEDWLISPALDMRDFTNIDLAFDHAGRYVSPFEDYFTLCVSDNYDGTNLLKSTWKQVTIPNYMTGADFTFFNSGKIDLTEFAGKQNVHFAFKYISTVSATGTWEIRNVAVVGTK